MNKIVALMCSLAIVSSLNASSEVTLNDAIKALELAIKDIKNQRSEIERLKSQIADMNHSVQNNSIDLVKKQIAIIENRQKTIEKQNTEIKLILETRPKLSPFTVESAFALKDIEHVNSKAEFYKTLDGLRIREEADINSKTIGLIEQGKPVEVTEIKNSYGFIGKGWVQMNYLQKVGK